MGSHTVNRSITSLQNPRVKEAVKLRDSRQRARQARFLIDGARELLMAFRSGIAVTEVFVCESLCHSPASRQVLDVIGSSSDERWDVSPAVFARLAFGERAEGVLGVAKTPTTSLEELALPPRPLVAVLEGIEKPGNLGAVLRSADGAGVSAVIVVDGRTDLYNPNAIRASLGTIFTVKVCEASANDALAWLRTHSLQICAARVDASHDYAAVDYRGPTAFILGNEAGGLRAAWNGPDVRPIRVPMRGAADSLNISATAAILFYEALRQRSTSTV